MGEYYGVRMKNDPDGEYLQHWGVPKGFMREGHKYLARLVTPSGYRYLYTQAQVAAAKAGRAIGNAIGLNQRSRAQQATARAQRISGGNKGREQSVQGIKRARMAKATAKRAQSAYDKTLLGRAEKAFNSARKGISDAASGAQKAFNDAGRYASKQARNIQRNVSRTAQNVGKAVGDATGYNQRNRAQKAAARAQRVSGEKTGRNQSVQTMKRSRMANATARSAQSAYERTPLGRVEKAFNNARKSAAGAASSAQRAANDAFNTASKNVNRAVKRVDNNLGITAQGRRNKKAAEYKQQMINRSNSSQIRRRNADVVNAVSREQGTGVGRNNWASYGAKEYLNSERAKRRGETPEKPSARRRNTTNPNSKSAQIRRRGVDSALNLMRTGQGLDPYNITKRGAAYRRKKRR